MNEFSWDNTPDNPMRIQIFHNGKPVMHLFLGEAMEGAGRTNVMRHVRECDQTPWIKDWHKEAVDEMVNILKADYDSE